MEWLDEVSKDGVGCFGYMLRGEVKANFKVHEQGSCRWCDGEGGEADEGVTGEEEPAEEERRPHPFFCGVDPKTLEESNVVGVVAFSNLVEAKRWYSTYSAGMGFGIQKQNLHCHKDINEI
ncbi:hypothetical protein COLO4_26564 [Corchorus olitorius]|uniref:Uncharacterized protein n=1 Tax=Corchorus olitorius TaxID=93759 RepID=A0A1R3HW89_9ROSI|nr:hypothetical protein COLO4_26564 [Corchorus olitorius]